MKHSPSCGGSSAGQSNGFLNRYFPQVKSKVAKTAGNFFLFLGISATAQATVLTVDSGWFDDIPTTRAVATLGNSVVDGFTSAYGESKLVNTGIALAEGAVSWQYLTALHELGHARQGVRHGRDFEFENGTRNFWQYLVTHRPFESGAVMLDGGLRNGPYFDFISAGHNATTLFAERNSSRHWSRYILTAPARLSAIIYDLSPQPTEIRDDNGIDAYWQSRGYSVRMKEVKAWQAAAFAASLWRAQFFTYLNRDGLSIRAVDTFEVNGKVSARVALEAVVRGDFEAEAEIGLSARITRRVSLSPSLVVSRNGIGGEIGGAFEHEKWRCSLAARFSNPRTLSGAREARYIGRTSTEVYAQIGYGL